jgi:GNAT superfamily N-acetyltransferase
MATVIRPAIEADLATMSVLWLEYMRHHARIDRRYEPAGDGAAAFAAHVVRAHLGRAESLALVAALASGGVVGFLLASQAMRPPVFAERRLGMIHDLMVEPSARRGGIGRALVGACLEWFARRGETQVEVRRHEGNPEAVAFWQSLGFTASICVGAIPLPRASAS